MAFWAVARLQPQRENVALHFLAQFGFETYAPKVLYRTRRRREYTRLLFPGYAFVLIVLQWHVVRRTPGVINLVMFEGKPAAVADAVISDLKSRECDGFIVLPRKPKSNELGFRPNDRVRIIRDGPLRGLHGLFAGQAPHDRIQVLLQMLGGPRAVEFTLSDVVKVLGTWCG